MTGFTLIIPGKPRGKGRPKFARRGEKVVTYTDDKTASMEETIRAVWRENGAKRLPDGPLEMTIRVVHERPKNHFRKNGSFTKAGQSNPVPTRKPDLDNVTKLACDALNGLGYRDDAQIASLDVRSHWGLRAHTLIQVKPIPTLPW